MTEIEVQNERVDDIPLLIGQVQKMGVAEVIDTIVTPHWRRQGLSVGQTIMTWLTFILSESDHRLSYVEPCVATHLETLRRLLNPDLTVQDFSDDRLGDILRYLSDDASWAAIEQKLGQRMIRVYQLPQRIVRLDSTTVSLYHDPEGTELIRYGHSKDHRPDLAQQIGRVLSDTALQQKLQSGGRQCVVENFPFEQMVDQLEAALHTIGENQSITLNHGGSV